MERRERHSSEADLDCCPACGSGLVQPTCWRKLGDDLWQLDLRCPECGDERRERAATDAVQRLDDALRHGRAVLEAHLREIERIDSEQAADEFARRLRSGAIRPDDFRLR
jgi:hypothetical protein